MRKRVLPFLLAMCIMAGIVPNVATADDQDIMISEYGENGDINEYGGERDKDARGNNWSYDAATETLTLNNFRGSVFVLCSRVILIGENTVTHFMCYSATVTGDGSLTVIATIKGSFVLDDQMQMIGGTTKGDTMPLTMTNGRVVKPDGTPADFVRIEPTSNATLSTTGRYTDVPYTSWYYEAVEYVSKPVYEGYSYGLMDGTTGTEFSPNTNADRATIVTALCRRFNFDIEGSPYYEKTFSDVPKELGSVVYWAVTSNIVTGYGNGTFGPYDPVTQEQFAVMLYRYIESKNGWRDMSPRADLSTYTDSSQISSWAADAMAWANARGFITGVTDTTLNPSAYVTRAEVATILMRAAVI